MNIDTSNSTATSGMLNEPNQVSVQQDRKEDARYCWVCFATDEDDEVALWVQPCKCSGTTKWVSLR